MQISNDTLNKFCDFLSHMGMYFPVEKRREAIPKIQKIVELFGFEKPDECFEFLTRTPLAKKDIMTITKVLTIGETYFFRNPWSFQALQNVIVPLILKANNNDRTIKIWSAGCCTGEEIYSLAIVLHQKLLSSLKNWEILLLGTDINLDFLHKAREACYTEWSFRSTPESIKKHYFVYHPKKKYYELKPEIKKMVSFDYLNLITDPYPSQDKTILHMDFILCNHVLIYFSEIHIHQVVQCLSNSLKDSGLLLVSDIELPFVKSHKLLLKKFGEVSLFIKKNQQSLWKPILKREVNVTQKHDIFSQKDDKDNIHTLTTWYQEKQYSKIITFLEERLKEEKNIKKFSDEMMLLTKAYANEGNFSKALMWCEKGLTLDHLNPLQHYLHGVILQELEQRKEAVSALRRALFLDTNLVIAHLSLAFLLIHEGEVEEANRCLRNVFRLLKQYRPEEIVQGTDDITAERLKKIAENITSGKNFQRRNS